MGYEAKLIRSFSHAEPQKLGFGVLLVACFMISIAYTSFTKPYEFPFSSISSRLSAHINPVFGGSRVLDEGSEKHIINVTVQNSGNQNQTMSSTPENITATITSNSNQSDAIINCNVADQRSSFCEMNGDIRILGNSSSLVIFDSSKRNRTWRIRPYARKQDNVAMNGVREVSLKTLVDHRELPHCAVNHTAPVIVFSVGGYTGNFFHDFTDVLVPLFLTSHQFNGEVHFLVTNMRSWWINKYLPIFKRLSKYQVIDFDTDDKVRCFSKAIVGLRSHKELSIDPSRSPNNHYSMLDFTKFMRNTYSLERETPTKYLGKHKGKKPRLLIISRKRTRRFTNINKITSMAEKLGFEVVVAEANSSTNMKDFACMVNSCDVMMGVHGAGLTNLVFLPTNAIFIQVVPWGSLDWITSTYFKQPAMDMKLRYLEYRISAEESTLMEVYPRDHPVFKDPLSIHKHGWNAIKEMFLDKQNVKLNHRRFRAVLVKALLLLRH